MAKILLVEDDEEFSEMVSDWLGKEHYIVECAHTAADAQELLHNFSYDLIILDWSLPEGDGVEICQGFRNRGGRTPILILTGKGRITEKEQGLDAGADDYLTKPVHLKELSARLRALLRRPNHYEADVLEVRGVAVDTRNHKVTIDGAEVSLLPKEFALLEFLLRNVNHVFSADELLDKVWRSDAESGPETVRTTIKRLRKKIDKDTKNSIIQSIYGVGYKIEK